MNNIENLQIGSHHSAMAAAVAAASLHPDQDTDPRELEAFAERFKQRRIKLGKYKLKEVIFWFSKDGWFGGWKLQSDNFDLIQFSKHASWRVYTIVLNWFLKKIFSGIKLKKKIFNLAK